MPVLSISSFAVKAEAHVVHFIGWVTTPRVENEEQERRIVVQFDMPLDTARGFWADLADALREEGDYGDRRLEVATAQFRDKGLDN